MINIHPPHPHTPTHVSNLLSHLSRARSVLLLLPTRRCRLTRRDCASISRESCAALWLDSAHRIIITVAILLVLLAVIVFVARVVAGAVDLEVEVVREFSRTTAPQATSYRTLWPTRHSYSATTAACASSQPPQRFAPWPEADLKRV